MVKELSLTFQQCLGAFTLLLFEGSLKRDFLGVDLTRFFWVPNFGNTSAMRVIFFKKISKLKLDFKNEEKNQKKFFVFEIIGSELIALNCLY